MPDLTDRARDALKQVLDPEAGINIVDLGLICDIRETGESSLTIDMTFTTEACPAGPYLMQAAETAVSALSGVDAVDMVLVFDPPWTPDRITADGRSLLRM
jgi:metal-sulfur cluster biosynthetic enzyme